MAQWKRYAEDPRNKEVITDDQTIGGHMLIRRGIWHADDSGQNAGYGGGCLWTEAGDGSRTATWRVDNPLIGQYQIFLYYGHPSAGTLATNAKIRSEPMTNRARRRSISTTVRESGTCSGHFATRAT